MPVDSNLLSTSSQREKGNDDSRSFHSDRLPNPIRELFAVMVGQGVFHGPSPFQASPLVGICSSHSKRLGFADRQWLQSAVQAIKYSKSSSGRLLIAEDTPYSTFLQHLCLRLQTPLSVIQVVRSEEGIVSQQKQLATRSSMSTPFSWKVTKQSIPHLAEYLSTIDCSSLCRAFCLH